MKIPMEAEDGLSGGYKTPRLGAQTIADGLMPLPRSCTDAPPLPDSRFGLGRLQAQNALL